MGLQEAKKRLRSFQEALCQPIVARQEKLHLTVGRLEARTVRSASFSDIQEAEFSIFSQAGEDGIIQYLISRVPLEKHTFVELGVGDYREANTRFLLQNDNWRGLIVDSGRAHSAFLRSSGVGWRHSVDARTAFLTRENVNEILRDSGFTGDVGLLSVDIDGNDYWVLDAIEAITPRILVLEYNSIFGPDRALTIPYSPDFVRARAHYSGLYFGASLAALCDLARRRGYRFVGSGSGGVNAFFVLDEVAGALPDVTPEEGWVESQHRESRDRDGRPTYVTRHLDRLRLIADLPLYDVEEKRTETIRTLFDL